MKWLLPLIATACAGVEPAAGPSISELIARPDARVMWVGAHPDDETLASSILAKACIAEERPCYFFVMNQGQGGECLIEEGCHPDVGTVRGREMRLVAAAYGAELEHHRYFNAPLPVESFPPRHVIGARWRQQHDPVDLLVKAIARFEPTILVTFDPDHGFTGHPEHQLAARFALAAVRRAWARHPIEAVYYVLNRYWMMRIVGAGDARSPTETFDTHALCNPGVTCLDLALAITRAHRTQAADMGQVRAIRPQLGYLYLRRVDPFDPKDAPRPLEPASAGQ